jgi:hypothetical protein
MIKSHTENILTPQTIVSDIICNVCGKSIIELDQNRDYLHIEKDWVRDKQCGLTPKGLL